VINMDIVWLIVILFVVAWFLGFAIIPIGGGLIHLLLVVALIIIVYRLATGKNL